jgi:dTDP-glucose 4,6-dehydratase
MILNAIHDKPLPVYGDGLNVRDWIHVEDHCAAIVSVLLNGKPGEIYNVGSDGEMRNIDVVKMILEHLGKPQTLIQFVPDRLGHDRRYAIDSTKIHAQLGWKALHQHEHGIRETIDWYVRNRAWWEPLLKK